MFRSVAVTDLLNVQLPMHFECQIIEVRIHTVDLLLQDTFSDTFSLPENNDTLSCFYDVSTCLFDSMCHRFYSKIIMCK